DAGLDVRLVAPADPSAPPRLVAAGEGDVAISYQPNLYLQAAEKLPLVRFGTLVATPLNSLVVLAGGDVKTIADLKGKTVGFSVGGFEDALLKEMLAGAGLSLSDVNLVNINFALTPALISGRVDAVIGAFRNFELTQLDLEGSAGLAFYPEEHGVPAYDELILLARRDRIGDDRLKRLLAAIEKAALFITNHPEEAFALFIKAHPDLNDELNRRAFADTLPRFSKSPAALDAGRYARFGAFMAKQGLIAVPPAVADIAVTLE
ncbi:MAG TPA: ABC transporter substrate-binding protein, partial [Afifellaceae bacterium]|nr:ABC transporter substrate-binding protein [Afifellaceae bacterium]